MEAARTRAGDHPVSVKDPEDDYDDRISDSAGLYGEGPYDDEYRRCSDCSMPAHVDYGRSTPCCDDWVCDECANNHNMVRCAARLIRRDIKS